MKRQLFSILTFLGIGFIAISFFAPFIGLGDQETFILYKLLGIARRSLLIIGVILSLIGIGIYAITLEKRTHCFRNARAAVLNIFDALPTIVYKNASKGLVFRVLSNPMVHATSYWVLLLVAVLFT